MVKDMVLLFCPVICEEVPEGSNCLSRLLELDRTLCPLGLDILLICLLSKLPLELHDDDVLTANFTLDGLGMLLESSIARHQDILMMLAGVAVLELIGILISAEDGVSGCDEVDLLG